MRYYFLKTKRLGFSTWNKDDFKLAFLLWSDENVTKYIFLNGKMNESQIRERFEREIKNNELYKIQYFPIFNLENDEFLGAAGLKPYDVKTNSYEMGFYFIPKFWGKGYAKEASIAIINYALYNLKADDIFAGHHPSNDSSKNLLLKLGFNFIGYEFFKPTGLNHPLYKLNKSLYKV